MGRPVELCAKCPKRRSRGVPVPPVEGRLTGFVDAKFGDRRDSDWNVFLLCEIALRIDGAQPEQASAMVALVREF